MSKIADKVHSILLELFPSNPIKQVFCEYYINFMGKKLYFDFYIKSLNLFIEVQGRQHVQFVKHFHGDRKTFLAQKERDNLKRVWAEENDFSLFRILYNEHITKQLVLDKIKYALSEGFYE